MENQKLYNLFDLLGEYLEEMGYDKRKNDAAGSIQYTRDAGDINFIMEFEAMSMMEDDRAIRARRGFLSSNGEARIRIEGFSPSNMVHRYCLECMHSKICKLKETLVTPEAQMLGFCGCKHFAGTPPKDHFLE